MNKINTIKEHISCEDNVTENTREVNVAENTRITLFKGQRIF